jgi:plastocyanin
MRTLKHLPALLIAAVITTASQAQNVYTLVATDFQFDPVLLQINTGDTVRVTLGPGHSFREVSQASWDLNVSSPGIGWEFSASPELTVHELVTTTPDTIYYVCVQHADMGMKGRIVVTEGSIGMGEPSGHTYRVVPNPTNGLVRLAGVPGGAVRVRVTDATGRMCVEHRIMPDGTVDLSGLDPGQYTLMLLDGSGRTIGHEQIVVQGL